ncbi:MAG: uroporphyrinogen-III synthase [Chlamydiia bacterium]|nr:uroporphyrinogen-III synthase [Chlamydiia bacterium]
MKKILYLGIDPTHFQTDGLVVHYPIIQVAPRSHNDPDLSAIFCKIKEYTHIIFTSKTSVRLFFINIDKQGIARSFLAHMHWIVIGKVTALHLRDEGFQACIIAQNSTQEGLIQELISLDLSRAYLLFPRSSLSRPLLVDFFDEKQLRYDAFDLYDTVTNFTGSPPHVNDIDEIVFTSPSCVEAFFAIYGFLPDQKRCVSIGPITHAALEKKREEISSSKSGASLILLSK